MCITFLMVNEDAKTKNQWQLVLINNRDEDYRRLTAKAEWKNDVLCGCDMSPGKEGGTWFGITKTGQIGVLLNIMSSKSDTVSLKSRGFLVPDYLKTNTSPQVYIENLLKTAKSYDGFNLILLDKNSSSKNDSWKIAYYTNETNLLEELPPGFYGFGNSPRSSPFLKVQQGLNSFRDVCVKHSTNSDVDSFVDDLLTILTDKRQHYPDDTLNRYSAHRDVNITKLLSSCFIAFSPPYTRGTRTHTLLLIDGQGGATYVEKNLNNHETNLWTSVKYNFQIEKL